MPNPYFLGFEILETILFFLFLRHAWRTGNGAVLHLIAGFIFGILLELISIRQSHAYSYAKFAIML